MALSTWLPSTGGAGGVLLYRGWFEVFRRLSGISSKGGVVSVPTAHAHMDSWLQIEGFHVKSL